MAAPSCCSAGSNGPITGPEGTLQNSLTNQITRGE
jgi:hypothetical protein